MWKWNKWLGWFTWVVQRCGFVIGKGNMTTLYVPEIFQEYFIVSLNILNGFTTNCSGYIVPAFRGILVILCKSLFKYLVLFWGPTRITRPLFGESGWGHKKWPRRKKVLEGIAWASKGCGPSHINKMAWGWGVVDFSSLIGESELSKVSAFKPLNEGGQGTRESVSDESGSRFHIFSHLTFLFFLIHCR